jgi:hypothetical protein
MKLSGGKPSEVLSESFAGVFSGETSGVSAGDPAGELAGDLPDAFADVVRDGPADAFTELLADDFTDSRGSQSDMTSGNRSRQLSFGSFSGSDWAAISCVGFGLSESDASHGWISRNRKSRAAQLDQLVTPAGIDQRPHQRERNNRDQ